MGLLLKQLDIRGFKSFANPTTFVFDRGITAIIGPNGSGKSNVAEALRWVLGEQGHANLRSRRTEDVIFSGSDKRPQQSLAEVTLVLDNADGSLPLAFSEVTISRRAFRTGENQYLINGGRVRLRDVQQLVAPLGQAYTIIGQGLVDAALSQRPEERRGLFEHAAGISGLRLRANDAERSLQEALGNAQRLRDILGELEPRVRSLERSARLAREYGAVRDRLRSAQRLQLAAQWTEANQRLDAARSALHDADGALDAAATARDRATADLAELRTRDRELDARLQALATELRDAEQALLVTRHQLDLLETRARANEERLADAASAIEQLELERDEIRASLASRRSEARELESTATSLREQVDAIESAIAAAAAERQATLDRIAAAERLVVDLTRRHAAAEGRVSSLAASRDSIANDIDIARSSRDAEEQSLAALRRDEKAARERAAALDARLADIAIRVNALDAQLADAEAATRQAASAALATEREIHSLRSRLDALENAHRAGDGLYAGVRAIRRAVQRRDLDLPGFVGVLAETIDVPPDYETAIEVALGGHLQDIVVRTWSDAERAIEYLKRSNAGRATFQPLDTIRRSRSRQSDVRDPDLCGVASALVRHHPEVAPIVEQLLGRTLVVSTLDASRRIVASDGGWTIVTLTGEITRPSGSVTGGARAAESGILARERERRALPERLAALEKSRASTLDEERRCAATAAAVRAERDALRGESDKATRESVAARAEVERVARELAAGDDALARADQQIESLDARRLAIDQALSTAQRELDELAAERERAAAQAVALRESLASQPDAADPRAATLRSDLAANRERSRSVALLIEQHESRLTSIDASLNARAAEQQRLVAATVELARQQVASRERIRDLEREIERLNSDIGPLRAERAPVSAAIEQAERGQDAAIVTVRDAERERDRCSMQVARAQDELVFIVERIRNDLDLDDPASVVDGLPDDATPPDEQEIARLRERLRRMAVVGPDVVEQYEAESGRLSFLSRELADVDDAAAGLRRVLDELNAQMATRFSATFKDVGAAFEQTFTRLFGGGSARLVLRDDDGATGIEIVAQPPGKRLQSLSALSGGERALTAVALLIAIQRVNPSPFCLLDEVDAALDESNVLRFRDEVRDLSRSTQFVLITHNRGTIEGADTLYGVTMGDDGVSRVLSLRLDDAIEAAATYDVA